MAASATPVDAELALTDGGAASIPVVLGTIRERFEQAKVPQSEQDVLSSASFLLCGLRFDDPDIVNWFEGVQGMEESMTYQWILRQGEERGELCAREQDVLDAIESNFGSVSPDIEQKIRAETDSARLRVALQSLFKIASIDEFQL